MELRTLANTPLSEITNTFNEAFSDYVIQLQFTEDGMAAKMKAEGIVPEHSMGAFDNGRLVGFILHAVDSVNGIPTVYNAGTGVIPAFRRSGLTGMLYQYGLPLLQERGLSHHVLEVIDSNATAKKIYEAVGFETVRTLSAYKGTEPITATVDWEIRPITAIPSGDAFVSIIPAWQNSTASILRDPESHQLVGAFQNGELVGYAAYAPAAGRVKQFAVHKTHRRKGIGTALFQYMMQNSKTQSLVITNVDNGDAAVAQFLSALKFQKLLGLYEMKLVLS